MPSPTSARVVRDGDISPFEFPLVGDAPASASGFVAWGAPSDEGPVARGRAVEAAYEEGVRAGRAEAEAAFQTQIQALREEVETAQAAHAEAEAAHAERTETAAAALSTQWTRAVRELEPRLVDLTLRVAEGMLGAPPSEAVRQAGLQAIAEAVDRLADGNPTTIALHPVDLLQHQESGFAETLSGAHPLLRWEPDSTLAPGDWVVSTPDAAVRRITSEALAALRDRLGLDAP